VTSDAGDTDVVLRACQLEASGERRMLDFVN
jgi:hypothetical protein